MSHIVIGTAGHVDHGKTALIRALTGIDTDRLDEEKARGLSIDLGFAYFDLPNGRRAGIIDVPEMGVKSALLPIGNNYIELLESTDPNNMTSQVLEQRGEGLLHIAIEVDDVGAEVKSLQERGVEVVDVPPAGEVVDYHSAFVLPDSAKGVPLELVPKGIAHKSQRKRLGLEVTDAPLPE